MNITVTVHNTVIVGCCFNYCVLCVFSGEMNTRYALPPRCYCRPMWDPSLDLIPYVSDIYWPPTDVLRSTIHHGVRQQSIQPHHRHFHFPLSYECYNSSRFFWSWNTLSHSWHFPASFVHLSLWAVFGKCRTFIYIFPALFNQCWGIFDKAVGDDIYFMEYDHFGFLVALIRGSCLQRRADRVNLSVHACTK